MRQRQQQRSAKSSRMEGSSLRPPKSGGSPRLRQLARAGNRSVAHHLQFESDISVRKTVPLVGGPPVQRDIRLYTVPENAAFHGADVIQNSRYTRTMAAGGNHFFSNYCVSSIFQEIIAGESRANIIQLLTNNFFAPPPVLNDRTMEHWVDDGISLVSNDPRNRWVGPSTIAPNAVTADLSPVHAERMAARAYKNQLAGEVAGTFVAKGVAPSAGVTAMLAQAEGVLVAAGY